MELSFNTNPHNAFAHYFKTEGDLCYFLYALSKRMEEGHICLPTESLSEDEDFWEDFSEEKPSTSITFPNGNPLISYNDNDKQRPFVFRNSLLYLSRYYFYETGIVEKLIALAKIDSTLLDDRKKELVALKTIISSMKSEDTSIELLQEEESPDWQLVATILGFLNNLTIITGGPGTGKTTTVAKILALLYNNDQNIRVALAAPTGKAAVRMKESLINSIKSNPDWKIEALVERLKPLTIHKLLGSKGLESRFFKADKETPLDYDVVIIDESSMIGAALFAKLLAAIGNSTRLILLGDSDQLASVDAGSIFGDLCKALSDNENKFSRDSSVFFNSFLSKKTADNTNTLDNYAASVKAISDKTNFQNEASETGSGVIKSPEDLLAIFGLTWDDLADGFKNKSTLDEHLIRLKKTYRYKPDSKMGKFTQAVIDGKADILEEIALIKDDSLTIDENYTPEIFENFVNGFADYINEKDIEKALGNLNNRRVLCAVRESKRGIYKTNQRIEACLKKQNNATFSPGKDFYIHQPILVTKNLHDLGLANGDIGIVRNSEWHQGRPMVFFPAGSAEEHGAIKDTNGVFTRLKAINPGFISDWETAYAMTIHKSQGSEFNNVMVILPENSQSKIFTRELLYTAVSRAKSGGKAIIQANLETIKDITTRRIGRVSGIKERIINN